MKPDHKHHKEMKTIAAFWAALAVLATSILVLSLPPVSRAKIKRLSLGMDTNEVAAILGMPSAAFTDTHGSHRWEYNRFSWKVFSAHFDASGHLVAFATD